jgi:trigger factor
VTSISAVRLPELDDEFAKSLQVENVDELKTRIKELLENAKKQMQKELNSDKLLTTLFERSTVYVSDNMWETLAERRMQETADEQRKAGKTMEAYAEENGMTLDDLAKAWYAQAKSHVERALLIREIFVKEKMQLSNTELNQELFIMASEFGMESKNLLEILKANNSLEELHFRAISRKVSEFLEANAEVSEAAAPAADEKPKKATKAKAAKSEEAPADAEAAPAEGEEEKPKKTSSKKKKTEGE